LFSVTNKIIRRHIYMQTTINQIVSVLKAGQPVGGMFRGQSMEDAVFYYYKDGVFYMGHGVNGGPGSMDEDITEEVLRRRLEGHFHSITDEEAKEDAAHISTMFNRLQAQAVREAEATPIHAMEGVVVDWGKVYAKETPAVTVKADTLFGTPEPIVAISADHAFALLNLLDDLSAETWVDGEEEEFKDAIEAVRALYKGLPRAKQKDVEELCVYTMIEE
jgi:hypothetical protein